jgi:mono/diheme cytochrome c family protein
MRELLRRLVTSSLVFAVSITLRLAPLSAAEDTATLFTELCSVCHGVGGKGDGPSAQGLEPKPADFTNCKAMAKDSDDVLFKIVKGGGQSAGRSTVMPAWGDSLSDQQIRGLVKYIRGLCKK